jgi:hypothetical protein
MAKSSASGDRLHSLETIKSSCKCFANEEIDQLVMAEMCFYSAIFAKVDFEFDGVTFLDKFSKYLATVYKG